MSAIGGEVLQLSAYETANPGAGEVIEVLVGEVLVFAEAADGRRRALTTVPAGRGLVGCAPRDGARLLVAGVPGTEVRRAVLDPEAQSALLEGWLRSLGESMAQGGWPQRVLSPEQAFGRLAPGEHVSGAPTAPGQAVTWLQVTAGTARYCEHPHAIVQPTDPAVAVPGGAWLTAGLRCQIQVAPGPATAAEWVAAMNLMGGLALDVAEDRGNSDDAAAAERIAQRAVLAEDSAFEAIDQLTAAVGGRERLPVLTERGLESTFGAAVATARAAGLTVSDAALQQAAAEIDSGRDPVAAIASACGARARSVTLGAGWWRREGVPLFVMIAGDGARTPGTIHWSGREWTLLRGADGSRAPVDEVLARTISRSAVELMPVLPTMPASLRALGRLALLGSQREMGVIAGTTALLAVASFVVPYLMGRLTGLFTSAAGPSAYAGLFGAMALVILGTIAWQALRSLSMLRARSRGVAIASGAVWERTVRQRSAWHNRYGLGERLAATNAVNNASATVPDETVARLLDVATVVGSLAAIATTSSAMLVALAALLAAQFGITMLLLRVAARSARARVDASAAASGTLMEILRGVNRLRVAGAESRAFGQWARNQAPAAAADQRLRRISMVQGVVLAVWPIIGLLVVIAVIGSTGGTYTDFVVAQTALGGAAAAVAAMSIAAGSALIAREVLRKAEPTLASTPEGGGEGQQPGRLSGGVKVRDLVLRYAPDLPPALNHVSVTVAAGEQVAIVGPSGCGKTTLMRAVLGLEEPESGVISVDDKDLALLDRVAVRRQIGSVLQSSSLLPTTIRENVDMGRSLTREQVWAALEAAAVGDEVRQLPMGIDTPVTDDGGTLSGGQRQRILIARALAGSPRMLILDEATSALDDLSQARVVESLQGLRITRIVVAHRLSTIRGADRIIVMTGGQVVDEGSYDQLIARPGLFADLVARQEL